MSRIQKIIGLILLLAVVFFCIFALPTPFRAFFHALAFGSTEYAREDEMSTEATALSGVSTTTVTHVTTPQVMKGVYMTSWVAGTPSLREKLLSSIRGTDVNTVVIDIKDYTGTIAFRVNNPALAKFGSVSVRIGDLPALIAELHKRDLYVIGRVAVFQDAYFTKLRPDLAVQKKSQTSTSTPVVWADPKGITWMDAGSREYWNYIAMIADEAYADGFDEINFDYIRYPSDGDLTDAYYPWSQSDPKPAVITSFFQFLHSHFFPEHIPISADLFGETTTAKDDMGIGQVFVNALPYFNFVDPMVYPSHYAAGFDGYKNPAAYPYEIVSYAMAGAVSRRQALAASSTMPLAAIRPWLQDFDLGAVYGPEQLTDEIRATNENSLSSWLFWSPENVYHTSAL